MLSHKVDGSYIENVATDKRIQLKESGGILVFEVEAGPGAKRASDGPRFSIGGDEFVSLLDRGETVEFCKIVEV